MSHEEPSIDPSGRSAGWHNVQKTPFGRLAVGDWVDFAVGCQGIPPQWDLEPKTQPCRIAEILREWSKPNERLTLLTTEGAIIRDVTALQVRGINPEASQRLTERLPAFVSEALAALDVVLKTVDERWHAVFPCEWRWNFEAGTLPREDELPVAMFREADKAREFAEREYPACGETRACDGPQAKAALAAPLWCAAYVSELKKNPPESPNGGGHISPGGPIALFTDPQHAAYFKQQKGGDHVEVLPDLKRCDFYFWDLARSRGEVSRGKELRERLARVQRPAPECRPAI